jgi:hypothetical protein
MKKEGVGKFVSILFLFVFLSSGILAVAPASGTCGVSLRSECSGSGYHILMGLSSETNAHGENYTGGTYPYVLCCAFGIGNKNCTGTNTILKLSSETNSHAQSPTQTGYPISICYEDLTCEEFTDTSCPEGSLGILSLSSPTNAHIGNVTSYTDGTKVCCSSSTFAGCAFSDVRWNVEDTEAGISVQLLVTGNDQCNGKKVSFTVFKEGGDSSSILNQPVNVTFNGANAVGVWVAEHQQCGLFGTDCSYYFNASLANNLLVSKVSSVPELKVSKFSEDDCANIATCNDYAVQDQCESDATRCNVAGDSSLPEVDCNDASTICGCQWDNTTSKCEFGYNTITDCGNPTDGCKYGCTLCYNHTSTTNYCNAGAICPTGDTTSGLTYNNKNGSCDFGIDGCLSSDCHDGDRDTCSEADGLYCLSGKCANVEGPPRGLGKCTISQTIEKNCDEEPVGSKRIVWTGIWTEGGTSITDCGGKLACEKCIAGGKSSVPCPAQVQLPFFDYIGIITTVLAITLIYVSMVLKRKFKRKK